jgi:hypothetical protein
MSALRLTGSTSGYSELTPPAIAGDQTFTLPGTGGTLDRLERAGNILQVVNATYSTGTTNSTDVYADTGLTASITPTSASSKIMVLVNQVGCNKRGTNTFLELKLLRDSTDLITFESEGGYTNTAADNSHGTCSCCYLDSPATASAITYKTQFRSTQNTALVSVQSSTCASTITLLEVAA